MQPAAMLRAAEQRGEAGGRIEPRPAEPVDRAVAARRAPRSRSRRSARSLRCGSKGRVSSLAFASTFTPPCSLHALACESSPVSVVPSAHAYVSLDSILGGARRLLGRLVVAWRLLCRYASQRQPYLCRLPLLTRPAFFVPSFAPESVRTQRSRLRRSVAMTRAEMNRRIIESSIAAPYPNGVPQGSWQPGSLLPGCGPLLAGPRIPS